MADITLDSYLQSDAKVIAAKKALTKTKATLEDANKAANANIPGVLSAAAKKEIATRVTAAQKAVTAATAALKAAISKATLYYTKNAPAIVKKKQSDIDVQIAELEKAKAAAATRGLDTKIYDTQIAKLKVQKSGTKVAVVPTEEVLDADITLAESLKNYTYDATTNRVFAPDTATQSGTQVYFVQVKDKNGKEEFKQFSSISEARDAFLKGYSATQLKTLKSTLISKKFLTSKELAAGEWLTGVDRMLFDYTASAVRAIKYEGVKGTPSISSWLKTANASGLGDTGVDSKAGTFNEDVTALTSRGSANRTINQYFLDWIDIGATDTQKDMYYIELNKLEIAAKNKYTTTKDANGNTISSSSESNKVTQSDLNNIAARIIKPVLLDMDIDTLMNSGKKAAQNISALVTYSASMGIKTSPAALLKEVGNTLTADGMTAAQARIKQNSITLYGKTLGSHIKAGGTVKEIVDIYAGYKSNALEKPLVDITDPSEDKDIYDAISGDSLMSFVDFMRRVYNNPDWGKTKAAHESAAEYTNTILKSFGFVA